MWSRSHWVPPVPTSTKTPTSWEINNHSIPFQCITVQWHITVHHMCTDVTETVQYPIFTMRKRNWNTTYNLLQWVVEMMVPHWNISAESRIRKKRALQCAKRNEGVSPVFQQSNPQQWKFHHNQQEWQSKLQIYYPGCRNHPQMYKLYFWGGNNRNLQMEIWHIGSRIINISNDYPCSIWPQYISTWTIHGLATYAIMTFNY